jgi:hypothetical protein
MTSIKNHKTSLFAIAALAGLLLISTSAIGRGHIALAGGDDTKVYNNNHHGGGSSGGGSSGGGSSGGGSSGGGSSGGGSSGGGSSGGGSSGGGSSGGRSVLVDGSNTGISVQTDTHQKQDCQTVGGTSGIANSCIATSTDTVGQSGGMLKK